MIDFAVLPRAFLFIAQAIPNTLFMAFISLFFGILFGSVIAVIRQSSGRFVNGIFAVLVSFSGAFLPLCSSSSCTIPCLSCWLR